MSEGYTGLPAYYAESSDPITPNLLLSLKGMDPIVAENFVLVDAFAAGPFGSAVKINGSVISNPNFVNSATVTFSVVGSNVSATAVASGGVSSFIGRTGAVVAVGTDYAAFYAPISGGSSAWANLTGDLTETQVIPWDGPTVGTADTSLSRISAGLIGVGTGAQGSHAGSLSMANITVSGTTSFAAASIAVAALSADTIGLTDSTGLFTVTGSPATLGGSLTLSAFASQSQNYVLAGPATGGAGAAAFRALVAADIPSAANLPLWSNLQNAAAALTLANANYATTFNQTSAVAWLWANTTVGTVGSTNASPLLELAANYWATGAVTGTDTWTIGSSLVAGLNGASTLTIAHSGSTGANALWVTGAGSATQSIRLTPGTSTSGGTTPSLVLNWVGVVSANLSCNTSGHFAMNVPLDVTGAITTTAAFQANPSVGVQSSNGTSNYFWWTESGSGVRGSLGFAAGSTTLIYQPGNNALTGTTKFAIDSTGTLQIGGTDTGISRLGAASLAIGNGTASDTTGNLSFNKVIKYAGVATVKAGVGSIVASTAVTGKTAAITATTIYAVPSSGAGMYKVSWTAWITTAAAASSTLGGTNGFQTVSTVGGVAVTDSPTTPTISALNTTATKISGVLICQCDASTALQYAFGYTDATAVMTYSLNAYVEFLG